MFFKSNIYHIAVEAGSYELLLLLSIKIGALSQHFINIFNQPFKAGGFQLET